MPRTHDPPVAHCTFLERTLGVRALGGIRPHVVAIADQQYLMIIDIYAHAAPCGHTGEFSHLAGFRHPIPLQSETQPG